MSALVGKLISVGLDDLAVKEVRILKRRLDAAIDPASVISRLAPKEAAKPKATAPVPLDELLCFDSIPSETALLTLASATQLQVLKLMKNSVKASVISSALPRLRYDYPTSPVQLLLHLARKWPSQQLKASRQLELLSQLAFNIASTGSIVRAARDDTTSRQTSQQVSPDIALEVQTLALLFRLEAWALISREEDLVKEIWEPYAKCLTAFSRRSIKRSSSSYETAYKTYRLLSEKVPKSIISKPPFDSAFYSIYKTLGSLAQDCSFKEDAVRWAEKVIQATGTPDIQRCMNAAKLLALKLRSDCDQTYLREMFETVLTAMDSKLKGESSEIDELLADISKARRAAITLLSAKQSVSQADEAGLDIETRKQCEELVSKFPRFALRYLGNVPTAETQDKEAVRFNLRRQNVTKVLPTTIDSVLFLIKTLRQEGCAAWDRVDAMLRECLELLDKTSSQSSTSSEEEPAKLSYHARISNQYYSQHVDMRRASSGTKDILYLEPLCRSIDSIRSRTLSERKAAAFISKLERYGDLLRMLGMVEASHSTFIELRNDLIYDGVLQYAARIAERVPRKMVWDESQDCSLLSRTLTSIVKLQRKRSPCRLQSSSLVDEQWTPAERGLVLEHALDILSNQFSDDSRLKEDIYQELLALYDAATFPVRRLRVICSVAQTDPSLRKDIMEEARKTIALTNIEGLIEDSEDRYLLSFAPHLQSLLANRLELLEEHPRIDLIRPHLAAWCSMVEKNRSDDQLRCVVDDIPGFISHLQSVVDFLDMKGFATMRVGVLRMIADIGEVAPGTSTDAVVADYSHLATQYLELGYSGKAGLALDRAQLLSHEISPDTTLRRLISHADYLLKMGNLDKCEEMLKQAYSIATMNDTQDSRSRDAARNGFDRIVADASTTLCELALHRGRPEEALMHAKRSLRIIARAWKRAERKAAPKSLDSSADQSSFEDSANSTQDLTDSSTAARSESTSTGPSPTLASWQLVKPMFRCFMHLSKVYAHHGMFQDTIYYAEQAHKVAVNIDSMNYVAEALVAMGTTWMKAGNTKKAADYLTQAKDLGALYREPCAAVSLKAQLGKLYSLQGYEKAESTVYQEAESILNSLFEPSYIADIDRVLDSAAMLQAEMSRLTLEKRKKQTILPPKRTTARRKPAVKGDAVKASVLKESRETNTADQCLPLQSMRGSLLRQTARNLIKKGKPEDVMKTMVEAGLCRFTAYDAIDEKLTLAEHYFHECAGLLPADPVYSVLQDSTISYPAIVSSKVQHIDKSPAVKASPQRKTGVRRNLSQARGTTWSELLKQAHENLIEAYSMASQISSMQLMSHIASFLNTTSVLLSTYSSTKAKAVHPAASAAVQELAKAISIERERNAVIHDASAVASKDDDLQWPEVSAIEDHPEQCNRLSTQQAKFQKDYIDIIPATWNVVSIALSETRQELILTRFEPGHGPFIVRVPLERNASRDADEELFGFDQGKSEMLDIIDLANANAHGGRAASNKAAKLQWWADRDELNNRIKELLENIEKVWLGGFRGIFSQSSRQPSHLARFQKSFQNMLDKHLPSRQRGGKRTKAAGRVTLDPRILELFIGLGDPFSEDSDLEEPLTDLLYFVIDILQFHGERNAYDEIDFDSMVVDTLDALQAYHQSVHALESDSNAHTVLILDKSLHCFPWESLPCMQGQPVSRLPSMGCLRDRILAAQKATNKTVEHDGIVISRSRGSYILNPGQDLSTTQSTFEEELACLSSWVSIANREPSETEIKDILERDDLYLYFGHGSGAQYIRSKTIKKLSRCATTFLMGCSSATLTDAGEFSVYGPSMSYIIAGAPAVVGTLWDVTDKDIDRFAKKTFEEWDLYGKKEEAAAMPIVPPMPKTPGRGRRRVVIEEAIEMDVLGAKKTSVVQAVTKGRKACNYEYLTAAAVVVYGVPVYFE